MEGPSLAGRPFVVEALPDLPEKLEENHRSDKHCWKANAEPGIPFSGPYV